MAKKEETIIKNPSADEIEQIRSKTETLAYKKNQNKEEEKTEDKVDSQYFSEYTQKYSNLLKPKTDYFEPDPIPFKLPSGKHVVDSQFLTENNEIFIRRLSAPEERLFSKMKEKKDLLDSMNKALDLIIKTDGVSINDLSLIDKLAMFIYAIAITYGSKIDIADKVDCRACKREEPKTKVIVDILKDLEIKYVPDNFDYPFEVKLNGYKNCDLTLKYNYPTVSLEEYFLDEDADIVEALKTLIIDIYGTKANGNPVQKLERDGLLTFLSIEDRLAIKDKIKQFSEFGIQLKTDSYTCSNSKCPHVSEKVEVEIGLDVLIEKIFSSISK